MSNFESKYLPDFREKIRARVREIGFNATCAENPEVPKGTINSWCYGTNDRRKAKDDAEDAKEYSEEEYTDEGNKRQLHLETRNSITTVEELIRYAKVDLKVWKCDSFKYKAYQQTVMPRAIRKSGNEPWRRPSTKPIRIQMFSVHASFVKRVEEIETKKLVENLITKSAAYVCPPVLSTVSRPKSGYMLELSQYDAHFGMFAWGRETGGPDYDLNIAAEVHNKAFETLLDRSSNYAYDQVLMSIGQDLYHFDNNEGTTTKGTKQDCDTRLFKVMEVVQNISIDQITRVRRDIGPVHVMMIPGNHGYVMEQALGMFLKAWFRNDPYVVIDTEPKSRKYYEYGLNLIGMTHGDKCNAKIYGERMSEEAAEAWGRTIYREMHTGHFHHENTDEVGGIKVRHFPTLSPKNAWSSSQGLSALQTCIAMQWHREFGPVGTVIYNHQ